MLHRTDARTHPPNGGGGWGDLNRRLATRAERGVCGG